MNEIFIIGATGLVGNEICAICERNANISKVTSFVRKKPEINTGAKIELIIGNFKEFKIAATNVNSAIAISSFGSTIKKAGSQEAFRVVDYDYVLNFAQAALQAGISTFALVSSVGADPKSPNFYLRVKGEIENAIMQLPFAHIIIVRPSLLLGQRKEDRIGEKTAGFIANTFSFFIPEKYKPVQASKVAAVLIQEALKKGSKLQIITSEQINNRIQLR